MLVERAQGDFVGSPEHSVTEPFRVPGFQRAEDGNRKRSLCLIPTQNFVFKNIEASGQGTGVAVIPPL